MQYPLGLVFKSTNIEPIEVSMNKLPLLYGGPIQPERGFVIHRPFGVWRSSLSLREDVTKTTSNDIIRAIATKNGPKDALVTLGYVGWDENQLSERSCKKPLDGWCPYHPEILYEVPFEQRWEHAGLTIV